MDRKTMWRRRKESVETAGGAAKKGRKGRKDRRWTKARRAAREIVYREHMERVEARLPALIEEFPELEMYRDQINVVPTGRKWAAAEIAGIHFLLESYSRKGGSPDRPSMETWATSKGLAPDYLHRLTRRDGFLQAYHRMGLVRTMMRSGQLDQRTLDQASTSSDPRWMDQAQRIKREAAEGLGLVSGGDKQLASIGAEVVKALVQREAARDRDIEKARRIEQAVFEADSG
jgi:hypothetical protein